MKTQIVVRFRLSGLHRWEECPHEDVSYLKNDHRHLFYFEVKAKVTHDNRDLEFMQVQYQVKRYLLDKYFNHTHDCLYFDTMSCEMICKDILKKFQYLSECSVFEDGENGAIVSG